jgi:hypothetical protein
LSSEISFKYRLKLRQVLIAQICSGARRLVTKALDLNDQARNRERQKRADRRKQHHVHRQHGDPARHRPRTAEALNAIDDGVEHVRNDASEHKRCEHFSKGDKDQERERAGNREKDPSPSL